MATGRRGAETAFWKSSDMRISSQRVKYSERPPRARITSRTVRGPTPPTSSASTMRTPSSTAAMPATWHPARLADAVWEEHRSASRGRCCGAPRSAFAAGGHPTTHVTSSLSSMACSHPALVSIDILAACRRRTQRGRRCSGAAEAEEGSSRGMLSTLTLHMLLPARRWLSTAAARQLEARASSPAPAPTRASTSSPPKVSRPSLSPTGMIVEARVACPTSLPSQ
mmetsp:Transcript_35751/g.112898  ORF Transcript_35751/g.112898 Transcript_35751/m.112898 type:complete len:225 (+) Transcript_35751:326-1000(+)